MTVRDPVRTRWTKKLFEPGGEGPESSMFSVCGKKQAGECPPFADRGLKNLCSELTLNPGSSWARIVGKSGR